MKCANGHDSLAADYCDQCGVKIDGNPALANALPKGTPAGFGASGTSDPGANDPGVSDSCVSDPGRAAQVASLFGGAPKQSGFDVASTPGNCPNCAAPKDGASIFCEDCGYDFVTGVVPVRNTASGVSGPNSIAPSNSPPAAATVLHQAGTWMIVVATDRAQFDRVSDATVVFPVGVPDRVIELTADRALIGRRSTSRNIEPEIDLSPTPEDVAVSRKHAEIVRAADGSFTVTDLGSSNGTFLNGSATAISPSTAAPLANGDSISVGAWTTLTLVLP